MQIELELLLLLSELYGSIPLRTPDRYQVIYKFATDIWKQWQMECLCKKKVVIDVHGNNEDFFSPQTQFSLTMENVTFYEQDISASTSNFNFDTKYEKVFLPSTYFCCSKTLRIVPYYASLMLYTNRGLRMCRSYHAKCKKCKSKYYYGFSENQNGERSFEEMEYIDTLIFTSGVAFSKDLLTYFDKLICIGAMTFEKLAELYKSLHSVEINPDRIESSWFIYRVLHHVRVFQRWPRKISKEIDVETLCGDVYSTIKDEMHKLSLQHVCDNVGCTHKFIVIDGNEKLHRALCATGKENLTSPDGVKRIKLCIENPMRGNQYRQVSKYCKQHQHDQTLPSADPLDIRPVTRSMTKDVPTVVTSITGCKSDKAVDRFYNRSAGMFYIFRPCGYRLAAYEMYTAESLSSIFTYLVDLFGDDPANLLNGIVYDRSCGLHPFLVKLGERGNEIALRYSNLLFMVDIFHVEKHTTDKCSIQHPDCTYHPHLQKFDFVKGINSEVAEQSFSRINPFKSSTRKMTYCRRLLYLMFIDEYENKRMDSK